MKLSECQWVLDRALEILLECNIRHLPVDLYKICRKEGILLISYRRAGSNLRRLYGEESVTDGVSFVFEGRDYILYDDIVPMERQRYTIAHELGHCMLEHFELCCGRGIWISEQLEVEAEQFAIGLLAPGCVLCELGLHTAEKIAQECGVPHTVALRCLEALRSREEGKPQFPLEQMVRRQFEDYIQARQEV